MYPEYQNLYGKPNADDINFHSYRRMTVSSSVNVSDSIWDAHTGRLFSQTEQKKPRKRVQGMKIEVNYLLKKEEQAEKWAEKGWLGKRLNLSTALLMAMAMFVLFGMFTLSHRSSLEYWNEKYEIAMRGVAQIRTENEAIQERIEKAKDEGDIVYRAANDLGMVRAGEAHTILLNAVDAYPQQAVASGYTAEVFVGGWGEEYSQQMPMSASAD